MSQENISIREATLADAHSIAELLDQLGYIAAPQAVATKLEYLSNNANDRVLVAVIDSTVVGSISLHVLPLFETPGNMGRITSLVINEKFRSRGIGHKMVRAAEDWFATKGCEKVEVTSADRRLDAHRFYEQQGYARQSQRFAKPLSD